jgi:tRNA threonylcarbamoyl adenosine modification protein YjeE
MSECLDFSVSLDNEDDTVALAGTLALWARPGFVINLLGELGSGKSVLARAFIRALFLPEKESDVPSPSFPLLQVYEETRLPVFHADLYRLSHAAEAEELGLNDLMHSHCGVVEWADRLPALFSGDSLTIRLSGSGPRRRADVSARGGWIQALRRNAELEHFLALAPFKLGSRRYFEGDASARRYEKVAENGRERLLMDMPQRPDGPPVQNGKPYSAIAHLAEGLTAVVAINRHLVEKGYSAPQIIRCELATGFALIEDLGDKVYGRMALSGADMREPLETAAAVLADMSVKEWPHEAEAAPGTFHPLKPYDRDALLIEAELLTSWFFPLARGTAASSDSLASFRAHWEQLIPLTLAGNRIWTLRDYHSPNLIWIGEREGLKRVGLIDTQDAVLGHPAYDLVSLAQDARVDVSAEMQDHLVAYYCDLRAALTAFDRSAFLTCYAVLGAQRATKILGIFARLSRRDGKHGYLRHMPRVSGYLKRNLNHPKLGGLRNWYERYLPEALSGRI